MQNKTSRLHETALSVGLKIDIQKTKIISLNDKNIKQTITLKGNNIDEVENFTYLGTNISQDNGTSKDIMARINKARTSFCRLRTIALRWTPAEGKRKRWRPKETWRRTIESELRIIGMTWGEAERKAPDRQQWRALVVASCASAHEED
ncbi:uncharacterized protein LOC143062556 [Mytilus galloprovincialis]|uniref:uncharacterized protein LOC143062556 n=1 Tax=Mytilus galloprovincialis TaxID=29158 RepID=UPI003F7B6B53